MAANQTTAAATFRRTCVCQDVCWLLCNFLVQLHGLLSPSSCLWISWPKNNNFLKWEFVDLKCYPHFKRVFCSILLDFVLIPAPRFSPPLKSPSICWQQNLPSRSQRGIHLYMEGRRPLMETCSRWCNMPYGFFPHGSSLALVFNLNHLFVLLKSRGCSDFMLAMEIHIELVENSAVYDRFLS